MTPPRTGSPTPRVVSEELRRVVERWHQLPLDRALWCMPPVRALVQALADRVAAARGLAPSPVPNLGPAVVMDQLTVMVFDLYAAQPTQPAPDPAAVADELAGIRRSLSSNSL